jgi:hypothetical protein
MANLEIDLDNEFLTVNNINNGRLAAHIDDKIKIIAADIIDPNKPAKARREITIKIGFSPSKSRREADIDYIVTEKLASMEKEKTNCNVRNVKGKPFISNDHIEQQELEFTGEQNSAS